RRRARRVDLRQPARAGHRDRARLRKVVRVHDLSRDSSGGVLHAGAVDRGRGRPPRSRVGAHPDVAVVLSGARRRWRARDRDSEVYDQPGERAALVMKWTDTREIAIALAERHPDVDPRTLLFTDLKRWVLELPGFADDPKHSGEK